MPRQTFRLMVSLLLSVSVSLMSVSHLEAGEPETGEPYGKPWERHTIDSSSRGADGIDVADINGDGLADLTVGWEEGGVIRVYLNPGAKQAKAAWPQVTVGTVKSPEDARFVDLDGDGNLDVVSCTEGRNKTMYVHWGPAKADVLTAAAWKTERLSPLNLPRSWMFSLPLQIDGKGGTDLVAGSKAGAAVIGWYQAPENPRKISDWKFHPIYQAGWIMSLYAQDMDDDGDADIITTDRKGKSRGCLWLENPGATADQTQPWKIHPIGGQGKQVMFMTPGTLDGSTRRDFLTASSSREMLYFQQTGEDKWETHSITMPENTGLGKGVAIADVDLDGVNDILFTCEHSEKKHGVMWLSRDPKAARNTSVKDLKWLPHAISGHQEKSGIKFDLIQLLDLDADGDLDLLTCEERDNLGVIWYENPTR